MFTIFSSSESISNVRFVSTHLNTTARAADYDHVTSNHVIADTLGYHTIKFTLPT